MKTATIRYGRQPTTEAAMMHQWHTRHESRLLADAGWCLAAMIWGAVLMRLALAGIGG